MGKAGRAAKGKASNKTAPKKSPKAAPANRENAAKLGKARQAGTPSGVPGKKKLKNKTHIPIPALEAGSDNDEELSDTEVQGLGDLDVSFLASVDPTQLAKRNQREKPSQRDALERNRERALAAQEQQAAAAPRQQQKKRRAEEDEELAHEKRPRTFDASKQVKKDAGRLPIKGADGKLMENKRMTAADEEDDDAWSDVGSGSDADSGAVELASGSEEEDGEEVEMLDEDEYESSEARDEQDGEEEVEQEEAPLTTAQLLLKQREEFRQAREDIARLASEVLEATEENLGHLKKLQEYTETRYEARVRKLAIVSLMALYKDILPGYRIRLPTEAEKKVKVSKEVKALRQFEGTLLSSYQAYLKSGQKVFDAYTRRTSKTKNQGKDGMDAKADKKDLQEVAELVEVYARCMCSLLVHRPYFNFSNNIIQAVLPFAQEGPGETPDQCVTALRSLFSQTTNMATTLEVVKGIAAMIKAKNYNVRRELLDTFKALQLREDLFDTSVNPINSQKSATPANKKDAKHVSKKEKKKGKQDKELERELEQASAEQSAKELKRLQTEILKQVFLTYFRILKNSSASPLLSAVLQGLARYAHLINVDFFTDLLNVLDTTLANRNLSFEDGINCVSAAFQICSGQGDVLLLDLKAFFSHLYVLLLDLPYNTEYIPLVLSCFEHMAKQSHMLTVNRVASFVKRILTVATQIPSGSVVALLAWAYRLMQKYPRTQIMLDGEAAGSGVFYPDAKDPETACAMSSNLWELYELRRHPHPIVCVYAEEMIKCLADGNDASTHVLPPSLRKPPEVLFKEYNTSLGGFNPAIQLPKPHPLEKLVKKGGGEEFFLRGQERDPESAVLKPDMPDFTQLYAERHMVLDQKPPAGKKQPKGKKAGGKAVKA